MKDEKVSIETELKNLKDYSRKLETRLINEVKGTNSGSTNGNSLSEIINQQRVQINKVKEEKEKAETILESMYQKV